MLSCSINSETRVDQLKIYKVRGTHVLYKALDFCLQLFGTYGHQEVRLKEVIVFGCNWIALG